MSNVSAAEAGRGAPVMTLRLSSLRQLFNSLDPAPFHERDLDPAAERFIVGWFEDLSDRASLLEVRISPAQISQIEEASVAAAIQHHFAGLAQAERRALRLVLRQGRMKLLIGVAFLALCLLLRSLLGDSAGPWLSGFLGEGLLILGWVAMWGPLNTFLYEWWPVAGRAQRYRRLAEVPIRVMPSTQPDDSGAQI
ncbi:MAG: hypothetical protein GC199_08135 [Alphaproteobacteria bacterium]|nr:hypothetical protein [Alphaproteobacteria bacterium]